MTGVDCSLMRFDTMILTAASVARYQSSEPKERLQLSPGPKHRNLIRRKHCLLCLIPHLRPKILRPQIESEIERLIDILDTLDAPDEDLEDEGHKEPWLGRPEDIRQCSWGGGYDDGEFELATTPWEDVWEDATGRYARLGRLGFVQTMTNLALAGLALTSAMSKPLAG
jgi:hypothetical protein